MPNAIPCQLPPGSRLRDSLPRVDYLDSFEVPSRTPEHDVVLIYAAVFGHLPKVFKQLLVLRSRLGKAARHCRRVLRRLGPANRHWAQLRGRGQDRALDAVREAPG